MTRLVADSWFSLTGYVGVGISCAAIALRPMSAWSVAITDIWADELGDGFAAIAVVELGAIDVCIEADT